MELSLDTSRFKITGDQNPQFVISNGWLYVDLKTAKHHPLFGTSGWLAFFWLLLFISPVVGILAGIEKLSILNGNYTNLILFSFFIDFCLLFLSWLLASNLANLEPQSINYMFVYLICAFVLFFVTASVVTNLAYSSYPQVDTLLVLHLGRDAIFLTILVFYFTLSNRVNITYLHRTKVGSVFAKSLELTLSGIAADMSPKPYTNVYNSEVANRNKEIKNSHYTGTVENVSIDSDNVTSSSHKKDANASDKFFSRLFALKKVLDDGLITEADYEEKKKLILNDL